MDGNGRWARRRNLPRVAGHSAGVDPVRTSVETLWRLLRLYLRRELPAIRRNGIQFTCMGRLEGVPAPVRQALEAAMQETAANTGMRLNVARLYTAGLPDPDLLIRTSGEMRLSNFLLRQIAYTEIYVTDTLWPDFRRTHLLEAILEYQKRDRRFGDVKDAEEWVEAVTLR